MSKGAGNPGVSFRDVLLYSAEVEETYNVRIRLSTIPLSKKSGKSTHAIEVRAYTLQGRPVTGVEREQCLWPGGTARTREGAEVYLLTRLASALDEWSVREQRERETWEAGQLTPLEEYIAGSF
jgi:hypothetical protein